MLEPHAVDDVRFSESNSEDHILVETNDPHLAPSWSLQIGFIHRDDVIQLRNWLNEWIRSHS